MSQICTKCDIKKPINEFHKRKKGTNYYHRECKKCMAKRHKEFYRRHKDKWIRDYPNARKRKKEHRRKLRLKVFIHYSGNPPKCACCGETIIQFLTIDHTHNDGARHRKEIGLGRKSGVFLYKWLVDNEFPEGFQILCYNCNCGKRMNNGVCPHQQ